MEKMIRIDNLTKKYKDVIAVNHLSFDMDQNETLALLGVNGAGKTTTIKMLSCLVKPTEGDAFIDGHSIIKDQNKVKEIIGMSTQETSVARNLTVKENLDFYASLYNLNQEEKEKKISDLIKQFSLEKFIHKRTSKLSGGYQRKVSIALALVSSPKILFLDEPTLGLDVLARRELWNIIREMKKTTTIILTTHYLEEAEALSDRIAIMADGELKMLGTSKELIERTHSTNFEEAFIRIAGGRDNE